MDQKMACERAKPALLEYLMDEIPAPEREAIELHLRSCASCSRELEELQGTLTALARGEASEEIPRHIRIVAEPASRWRGFWLQPARLAFAAAGLLCVAVALLALFRTTFSYHDGNLQVAFGAPAVSSGALRPVAMTAAAIHPLSQAQVSGMISRAIAATEADRQRREGLMATEIARRVERKYQRDLRDVSESMRYFQAAQTMLWKGQVENQHLVSTLIQKTGFTTPVQR